ncbi:MAG: DUF4215 domain-containing protein [Minicystis sp.]
MTTAADFAGKVTAISVGHSTCALIERDAPNRLFCWTGTGPGARAGIERLANVSEVSVGDEHECVLLRSGDVRCRNGEDDRLFGAPIPLGAASIAISAGGSHICALLEDGHVKCWGNNNRGQLGQGHTDSVDIHPGDPGDALAPVDLGHTGTSKAIAISAGFEHTCALLDDGQIKCWGNNDCGQLGQGHHNSLGRSPGEMGDALLPVDLGTNGAAKAIAVSAGFDHTCALLADGHVKCWGWNHYGQLGQGHSQSLGALPGEMGDALAAVDLGANGTSRAIAIASGASFTCALREDGDVKCWGDNGYGELGQGHTQSLGDEQGEMGDALVAVDLGLSASGHVSAIAVGFNHFENGNQACALFFGNVKCWGAGIGDEPGEMGDKLAITHGYNEQCDDGNYVSGDGCSDTCDIELGYECTGIPSECFQCGDGKIQPPETCDDGNTADGDGCSRYCQLESKCPAPGDPHVGQAARAAWPVWAGVAARAGMAAWPPREALPAREAWRALEATPAREGCPAREARAAPRTAAPRTTPLVVMTGPAKPRFAQPIRLAATVAGMRSAWP